MSGVVAAKLQPPTIGESIPAFYAEGGTATIAVPFSMNLAVQASDVYGLVLKIKTVQSNVFLETLYVSNYAEVQNMIVNRIAKFDWPLQVTTVQGGVTNLSDNPSFQKLALGQFLKVQMAYIDSHGNTGYFSTVGIVKYTSKPTAFIQNVGYSDDTNEIPLYKSSYIGVYQTGEDKSERPYSYCFFLYDNEKGLVESSEWKLHNSSVNNLVSESLSLNQTIDTYSFVTPLVENKEYYIQYGVKTINNLEVYSPLYTCVNVPIGETSFKVQLKAENRFDDACINLHLEYIIPDEEIPEEQQVSIVIERSDYYHNYTNWQPIKRMYFSDSAQVLNWSFNDFTIEQGIIYKYGFRQYNSSGVESRREESNTVAADFEDMFLWDGQKQLKIRFNPKMTSFKATRLEQKMDTIGSKYPFIFRNGIVNYKEFPIAGLITYLADNAELFVNYKDDLNIDIVDEDIRNGSPSGISVFKNQANVPTTSMVGYNVQAERRFKLMVLEWLNNGQIKLFKSATEGNYLVRLMNISLTPEDNTGRMVHSFQATAYEVEDLTYSNLLSLGFIQTEEASMSTLSYSSTYIRNYITSASDLGSSAHLNGSNLVVNRIIIEPTENPESIYGFYLRIGADSADNRVYISSATGLRIESDNSYLPDIYFNVSDNLEIINATRETPLTLNSPTSDIINALDTLIADAVLYYEYYTTVVPVGEYGNIQNVFVKNKICTYNGPWTATFDTTDIDLNGTGTSEAILKFFVLNFVRKPIMNLWKRNGSYYDSQNNLVPQSRWDLLSLYHVIDEDNSNRELYYRVAINESTGINFTQQISSVDYTVSIKPLHGEIVVFQEIPILNLNDTVYESISIGNGIYLECAYQSRTIVYNE